MTDHATTRVVVASLVLAALLLSVPGPGGMRRKKAVEGSEEKSSNTPDPLAESTLTTKKMGGDLAPERSSEPTDIPLIVSALSSPSAPSTQSPRVIAVDLDQSDPTPAPAVLSSETAPNIGGGRGGRKGKKGKGSGSRGRAILCGGEEGNNTTPPPATTSETLATLTPEEELTALACPFVGRVANQTKRQQCENEHVLYLGHSHLLNLKQAHCNIAWKTAQRFRVAASCPPYAWGRMTPYLEPHSMRQYFKTTKAFAGGGFKTIFLSAWSWDMVWLNNHPKMTFGRILEGLRLVQSVQRRAQRYDRASTDPNRSRQVKLIVMLPHYHRVASQAGRQACQTEERLKVYSDAVEAAAYQFVQDLQGEADRDKAPLAAEVLVLDIYNWTKQLNYGSRTRTAFIDDPWGLNPDFVENSSTWDDGGSSDFHADGAHLRESRLKELTLALFERGVLCDPFSPSLAGPSALSMASSPNLLRAPRAESLGYLDRINAGHYRVADDGGVSAPALASESAVNGSESTLSGSAPGMNSEMGKKFAAAKAQEVELTNKKKQQEAMDSVNWPSRPTCENDKSGSDSPSFWGNSPAWLNGNESWPQILQQLIQILQRIRAPRSDVLRHQVVSVLQENIRAAKMKNHSFLLTRFAVSQCLNNVGLTENSTTWASARTMSGRGNVDYILWKRRTLTKQEELVRLKTFLETLPQGAAHYHNPKRWKRIFNAHSKQLPAPRIPSCVCQNATHLLDDVHQGLVSLERAKTVLQDDQQQSGASPNNKSDSIKIQAAIAQYCRMALSGSGQ